MKICVSSQGASAESIVDQRFGRAAYFVVYDTESGEFESIDNSGAQAVGGAGVKTGQMVSESGVDVVLTGNVGPNAHQVLSAANIDVITGIGGSVKEVVDRYLTGEYKISTSANVDSHFGMK